MRCTPGSSSSASSPETVPVGLFHADLAGNLLFANGRLSELMGSPFGPTLIDQLERVDPEDRAQLEAALGAAADGTELDTIVRIPEEGRVRHCSVSVRPLRDDYGFVVGLTGCVEDVTASVQSRSDLEVKAISDPLTGCLNRAKSGHIPGGHPAGEAAQVGCHHWRGCHRDGIRNGLERIRGGCDRC